MTIEISLSTCHVGQQMEQIECPMSGELVEVPVLGSVNPAERAALTGVLEQYQASLADEAGNYFPQFSDCSTAEVDFKGLVEDLPFTQGTIKIESISTEIAEFLYAMAVAGNLTIRPLSDYGEILVTSPENAHEISNRLVVTTLISSAEEMRTELQAAQKFENWRSYTSGGYENPAPSVSKGRPVNRWNLVITLMVLGGLVTFISEFVIYNSYARISEIGRTLYQLRQNPQPRYIRVGSSRFPQDNPRFKEWNKSLYELDKARDRNRTAINYLRYGRVIGFAIFGIAVPLLLLELMRDKAYKKK
ncbi:hypothetical protein [Gimesia maris]